MDFQACDMGPGKCWAQWHEPPAFLNAVNPYSAATVFCVVRNPFDRVISEYRYISDNPEYAYEHRELVQQEGCSENGLNLWLDRVLTEYVVNGERFEQLCHMYPQSYYIWGPPSMWQQQCQYCQEIIHLEDFPGAFNDLMERYNYSVRLGPRPANQGKCQGLRPSHVNDANADLIRRVYHFDFAMLNYSAFPL